VLDTYRPDAFHMERFVSQEDRTPGGYLTLSDTSSAPPVALRILRPARGIRVQLTEGRPCKVAALDRHADHNELQGKILWSAGPWRSSGDWWAEQPNAESTSEHSPAWGREEWDIALACGDGDVALYRIYRDVIANKWLIDASYD